MFEEEEEEKEKKDKERKKFKSLDISVPDIETLKNILQVKDLCSQKKIEIIPTERNFLLPTEFKVEDIDRLYYIKKSDNNNFNLIARLVIHKREEEEEEEEEFIYVDCDGCERLIIVYKEEGDDEEFIYLEYNECEQTIFISKNVNLFMNYVLKKYKDANKYLIYELLWLDYDIDIIDYERTTHPNFESLDSTIKNINDIEEYMHYPLLHQYNFEKNTTPFENNYFLNQFRITIEDIDRLYFIKIYKIEKDIFNLIVRMQYEGKPLYVEMCAINFIYCIGDIYITRDVNIFMNVVLNQYYDFFDTNYKNLIYQSLMEDNNMYNIHEYIDTSLYNLCLKTIDENKDTYLYKHCYYFSQFPKTIKESIDTFIKMRVAKKAYDEKYNSIYSKCLLSMCKMLK